MLQSASKSNCTAEETAVPLEGNYFVAAYPSFAHWEPGQKSAVLRVLKQPGADRSAPFGLYAHIPFCLHRCTYCYYLAYAGQTRGQIDQYVDALVRELALYARRPAVVGRPLKSVYFGGGTPSLLSPPQIDRISSALHEQFASDSIDEITFECGPKTVNKERLAAIRRVGTTRISLGVQQLNDDVLQCSHRIHNVSDVLRAYDQIRAAGFDYVNLDLIVGLAGQTDESFLNDLEKTIAVGPESITLYQLEIPRNTPLYRQLISGNLLDLADWKQKRRRLASGWELLHSAGFTMRSAYTAVRDPLRHGFLYQDAQYRGDDLLAIGASSFGYLRGVHYQNVSSLESYCATIHEGRLPVSRAYELNAEEQMTRRFVLELKLGRVSRDVFRRNFGVDPAVQFERPLDKLARRNWLLVDHDSVRLTLDGLLRADHLLPAFYLPQHQTARQG